MKYILVISLFINLSLYKAQQIYPLNTFPDDVPVGSYMKDINNELNPFVGTWIATHNGKSISLIITKQEHKTFTMPKTTDIYYQDALLIKYIIKDLNGTILQNNNNVQYEYDKNAIVSVLVNNGTVNLYYTGTNCGVGWGAINLKPINNTQFFWSYYPNSTTLTTTNCPGNPDITIYLPDTENLVFTKQ